LGGPGEAAFVSGQPDLDQVAKMAADSLRESVAKGEAARVLFESGVAAADAAARRRRKNKQQQG
jgi:hypothetical protein